MVDTCAGEFPAKTPYYTRTFEEENESVPSEAPRKFLHHFRPSFTFLPRWTISP